MMRTTEITSTARRFVRGQLTLADDAASSESRNAMNAARAGSGLLASRRSADAKRCSLNRLGQSG